MKNKIILSVFLVFACIQLFKPEEVAFEDPTNDDFIQVEMPEQNIKTLLQESCYDCHSNQISYPWYSKIAPVSWWMADHIEEGREHLNLSEWGKYPKGKKAHKAEECFEEVEEEEMPLKSYTFIHRSANLEDSERKLLVRFFKEIYEKYED